MTTWTALLDAMNRLHNDTEALRGFCSFPDDVVTQGFDTADHPASGAFLAEDFGTTPYDAVLQGLRSVAPRAHWRRTYEETDIGADFMTRFGCFALIGPNAPFQSRKMHAFFVYMPAGLWYPWHHHLAEELYFVLAGGGRFLKSGARPEDLQASGSAVHQSMQSHALETTDSPVLAYVLWRDHFDSPPELTPVSAIEGGDWS